MTATTVTIDVLQQFLDAFNRHDLDAMMGFFAEECVLEAPRGPNLWGRRYVGYEAVRVGLAGRFAGIPNVQKFAEGRITRKGSYWKIVEGQMPSESRIVRVLCAPRFDVIGFAPS